MNLSRMIVPLFAAAIALPAQAERVGLSEGGMIAPIVAARSKTAGWLAGHRRRRRDEAKRGNPRLRRQGRRAVCNSLLKGKAGSGIQRDPRLAGYARQGVCGLPYRYWSSHLFHDPLPVLAQLDIPIVAAMGEKDDSVPIESGRLLKSYFARHPEKNFQFIEYEDANHGLQANGKSHLKPFLASLAKWFEWDKAKTRSLE